MAMDGDQMTRRILDVTLEIIYLLTGEDYGPMNKSTLHGGRRRSPSTAAAAAPHPELSRRSKILHLTHYIIQLLSGEVPVQCQDVALYFSVEDSEYLEGHKDLYSVVMKSSPPLMSLDESSKNHTSEQRPNPAKLSKSTEESVSVPQDHQDEDIKYIKVEQTETPGEDPCKKEKPTWVYPDESWRRNPSETCPRRPDETHQSTKNSQTAPQDHQEDGDIKVIKVEAEDLEMWEDDPYKEETTTCVDPDEINMGNASEICPRPESPQEESHSAPPNVKEDRDGELRDGSLKIIKVEVEEVETWGEQHRKRKNSANISTGSASSRYSNIYTCIDCGKGFPFKSKLIRHRRTHTGEAPYNCKDCGRCFKHKTSLADHKRIHTGEKPFACSYCPQRFAHRSTVLDHERTHTGSKPFSCSECGQCFTMRSTHVNHMRLHTGEKPFSCSDCGKCFAQKSAHDKHRYLHTGEKPFPCAECGKTFTGRSLLAEHERTHTGERPYPCSECGKSFSHRSTLTTHKLIHTGLKMFSCSLCDKAFTTKKALAKHWLTHGKHK
ncbi:uncharacterized protein [Dendrobates tinctorius]|uniref:uncharacterized protein n=1 Tax=Dendrobates tinctorius TaxID=92724 RepID=UPI003CCA4031